MSEAPQKSGKAPPGAKPDGLPDGRGRSRSTPDSAFDLWLNRNLHTLFDEVAREPIPPELLALIQQDQADKKK